MRVNILTFTAATVAGFVVGSVTTAGWSQDASMQSETVTVVSFHKVEPGGQATYEELESELWMPVHEERIRSGEMAAWELFSVRFPGGTSPEYNYVTINKYDSWEQSQGGIEALRPFFQRVHPDITPDQVSERTGSARETVRTELWTRLESLP